MLFFGFGLLGPFAYSLDYSHAITFAAGDRQIRSGVWVVILSIAKNSE